MDDLRVELDNNRNERALRGMTLGRENFHGNWSGGAHAAELDAQARRSGSRAKRATAIATAPA